MELNLVELFEDADHPRTFASGQTILAEGTPGNTMYVILDGVVEIRLGDRVLAVAGPGEIVGEMALIDPGYRSASAVARSNCRLAAVDEEKFILLVRKNPYFALHVMKVLVERLRHMDAMEQ